MRLGVLAFHFDTLQKLKQYDVDYASALSLVEFLQQAKSKVAFFNEKRDALLVQFGQLVDERAGQYLIPTDNQQEYIEKLRELEDVETGITPPDLSGKIIGKISAALLEAGLDVGVFKLPEQAKPEDPGE